MVPIPHKPILEQVDPPRSPRATLPTMYDLPSENPEDLGRFYTESATATDSSLETPTTESVNGLEQLSTKPPSKLDVYERYLRIPHYLVYSRYTKQLRYFKLNGGQYQEQSLNPENPIAWLTDLDIGLGIWEGVFEDISGHWLRWCDRAGQWLLTDTEQSEQQVEQERSAREQAQAQVLQAARNLLASGMDIERVTQLLDLSAAQINALRNY